MLDPSEVARIISTCRDAFDVAADAEITLEANPESVDPGKLAALRNAGVNRLSVGVQSFRDAELRRLSRLHDSGRARAALAEARDAGFDNISLDLMMWLPEQRVDDWLASVDAAIAAGPDHLSLYLLEVYPNAPLKDDMARARWSQAPDDDAATMYVTAMERLEAAGYRQYEISNVAKPGRESRHNLKYWTDGEWLGCKRVPRMQATGDREGNDGAPWEERARGRQCLMRSAYQALSFQAILTPTAAPSSPTALPIKPDRAPHQARPRVVDFFLTAGLFLPVGFFA